MHTLLWSGVVGSGLSLYDDISNCITSWEERIKLFADLNVDLKLLVPKKAIRPQGVIPVVDYFEFAKPDILVNLPHKRTEQREDSFHDQSIYWPRDNFVQFNGLSLVARDQISKSRELLENLGIGETIIPSKFAQGGLSLLTNKDFIYSGGFELDEIIIELLNRQNYRIHKMPSLHQNDENFTPIQKKLYNRMSINKHIDTELSVLRTKDGNNLLLVNNEYIVCFSEEVKRLKDDLEAKVFVIDNVVEIMYKAVNLLQLPSGHVVSSKKNNYTNKFLKDNLGYPLIELDTFHEECSQWDGGGGIRCRTNLITVTS